MAGKGHGMGSIFQSIYSVYVSAARFGLPFCFRADQCEDCEGHARNDPATRTPCKIARRHASPARATASSHAAHSLPCRRAPEPKRDPEGPPR